MFGCRVMGDLQCELMRKVLLVLPLAAVLLVGGYLAAQLLIPRHAKPTQDGPVFTVTSRIPKTSTNP